MPIYVVRVYRYTTHQANHKFEAPPAAKGAPAQSASAAAAIIARIREQKSRDGDPCVPLP
ncbi:unnamed protein product [Periconia digitata]|uniref:Uncharacterized protein n=1 Tax=Periconia digitata TaxID=1303443 RepID=A0A9W4XYN1_9PLEO|nr:unnamed protein product [Periconia digitata]